MLRSAVVIAVRFAALLLCLAPVGAAERVALVIGNASYQAVTALPNPVNDARDMAAALGRLGFAVRVETDLGYDAMRRALQEFADEAASADMAIIFFAGHGMEIDRQNYLLPVDARLETDRAVAFETVPMELALAAVDGAKTLKVVLLDACRNNPFAAKMKLTSATRSIGRGLSRIEPQTGTLVGFAAKEGTTAIDGEARNSPYTAALLAHIERPGLEISLLFRQVRDAVLEATGNQQEPFTYGSLPGRSLYFLPPTGDEQSAPTEEAPPAEDRIAWDAVKDSDSVAVLQAFIERFPDSLFSTFAAARLNELKAAQQALLPPPEESKAAPVEEAKKAPAPVEKAPPKPKVEPAFKLNAVCRGWLAKFRRGHKPHAAFAAALNGSCGWSAGGHASVETAIAQALKECRKQHPQCKVVATK
jgi:uncharacterized caspase-like protein